MDFLGWVYPRVVRAVERYRDRGFLFSTYLNAVLKLSAREYKSFIKKIDCHMKLL
jgi:hypothetical protein